MHRRRQKLGKLKNEAYRAFGQSLDESCLGVVSKDDISAVQPDYSITARSEETLCVMRHNNRALDVPA